MSQLPFYISNHKHDYNRNRTKGNWLKGGYYGYQHEPEGEGLKSGKRVPLRRHGEALTLPVALDRTRQLEGNQHRPSIRRQRPSTIPGGGYEAYLSRSTGSESSRNRPQREFRTRMSKQATETYPVLTTRVHPHGTSKNGPVDGPHRSVGHKEYVQSARRAMLRFGIYLLLPLKLRDWSIRVE